MPEAQEQVADVTETTSEQDAIAKTEGLETKPETTEETKVDAEKAETSETAAESSTAQEKKDESKDADLQEFLKDTEPKRDHVQERIDSLIAEKKQLQEENARLKNLQTKGEVEYSDEQLNYAAKKALADQDFELYDQIQVQRQKNTEKRLLKAYEEDQRQKVEVAKQSHVEWTTIVHDFSYLADPKEPEVYPGSKSDLDLNNPRSLLYRLASEIFKRAPDEVKQKPGGQRTAVVDALATILRKNRGASEDTSTLKRKLTKEKMKNALGGSDVIKEDKTPKRPLNDQENLNEYLEERKKFRDERLGGR